MCVFCEDMQNGYTSSHITMCFLNLLVFYPLSVLLLLASRSFHTFSLCQSFFLYPVKSSDQSERPMVADSREEEWDGFAACCEAFPPVPTQSGVHSCWVELKMWLQGADWAGSDLVWGLIKSSTTDLRFLLPLWTEYGCAPTNTVGHRWGASVSVSSQGVGWISCIFCPVC